MVSTGAVGAGAGSACTSAVVGSQTPLQQRQQALRISVSGLGLRRLCGRFGNRFALGSDEVGAARTSAAAASAFRALR